MDIFIQQLINGLVLGSMYALVALGYTMVYGIVNLINFAHGEVLMVGALVSWTVVTLLGDTGWPGWVLLTLSLLALAWFTPLTVVLTLGEALLLRLVAHRLQHVQHPACLGLEQVLEG